MSCTKRKPLYRCTALQLNRWWFDERLKCDVGEVLCIYLNSSTCLCCHLQVVFRYCLWMSRYRLVEQHKIRRRQAKTSSQSSPQVINSDKTVFEQFKVDTTLRSRQFAAQISRIATCHERLNRIPAHVRAQSYSTCIENLERRCRIRLSSSVNISSLVIQNDWDVRRNSL